MKDIKGAIELMNRMKNLIIDDRHKQALQIIIEVAEKVESVKGLPEIEKCGKCHECKTCPYNDDCETYEQIKIVDDCRIYIAKMEGKEICICAAVISEDGSVYRGHRHSDCFDTLIRNKKKPKSGMKHQGFITSKNRFVSREEGSRLQNEAGIKSVWTDGYVKDMLFSEDLY